jgi:hypothetical protein
MVQQAETVYRYFRADADHDISGELVEISADELTWHSATYIATGSLPPQVADVDAANPVPKNLTGYWWRVFVGPTGAFNIDRGSNEVFGRLTDNPELPHFGWIVLVAWYE